MNPLIQFKTTPPILITLALCWFSLSPALQAQCPSACGAAGGNTGVGINALDSVNPAANGINNTAVGLNALTNNTTGQYNVAVGSRALENNITGDFNMAIGTEALQQNTANFNLAIGFRVLFMNTTGNHLTGIGAAALRNNTIASFNTAIGADALRDNTTGENNTAIGADALNNNNIGHDNTATGNAALLSNTTALNNTATGSQALRNNTSGSFNTAIGASALFRNTTAGFNVAVGVSALANSTGGENTAIGRAALFHNTSGSQNIALGVNAGLNLTTGDSNIDIGNAGDAGDSDTIRIGATQDRTFIAGIRATQPPVGVILPVLIDFNGQLGTAASSRRFKHEIKPMDKASETILALKPVTFHYKSDNTETPQYGLIAEEVAEVNPDLVVRDKDGEIYTVRYEAVNAMLLNEFLKEHKNVQELKAALGQQQKEIAVLIAHIKEQDAKIQRVSDQLEVRNPTPQVASVR